MLSSTSNKAGPYDCNGSIDDFAFTFYALSEDDIYVILTDSTGVETTLTLTSDYTLTGADGDGRFPSGGSVATVLQYASGYTITIMRTVDLLQESEFTEGMATLFKSFEDGLDKCTMGLQQLDGEFYRALRGSDTDPADLDMALPAIATRASKYLAFNSDGEPVATAGTTSSYVVTTFAETLLDDTTATAMLSTLGLTISSYIKTLLDDADAASARATMLLSPPRGIPYKNLVIQNNATHPEHQVDVDADWIVLEHYSENGDTVCVSTVNLTIDLEAAAGANAIDNGTKEATTWYYIWVIYNGSTTAGILSKHNTISTIHRPSGYTYAAIVGAVYNGATDFVTIKQTNNKVSCAQTAVVTGGTAVTATAVDCATALPSTAKELSGYAVVTGSSPSYSYNLNLSPAASHTVGLTILGFTVGGGVSPFSMRIHSSDMATAFYYDLDLGGGTCETNIYITGWGY